MNVDQYLASLETVDTATLPVGTLFVLNRVIYEVIDSGLHEHHKARQWRKNELTEVALSPDSSFAQRLPVVATGKLLPFYSSREALLVREKQALFAFTTEQNALDAAYLDVALCGNASSLYVRRHQDHPAFEVTNGILLFRQYYYMRTNDREKTTLPDIKHELGDILVSHVHGPLYWRLLPSWDESPYDLDETVAYGTDEVDELVRKLGLLSDSFYDE